MSCIRRAGAGMRRVSRCAFLLSFYLHSPTSAVPQSRSTLHVSGGPGAFFLPNRQPCRPRVIRTIGNQAYSYPPHGWRRRRQGRCLSFCLAGRRVVCLASLPGLTGAVGRRAVGWTHSRAQPGVQRARQFRRILGSVSAVLAIDSWTLLLPSEFAD